MIVSPQFMIAVDKISDLFIDNINFQAHFWLFGKYNKQIKYKSDYVVEM